MERIDENKVPFNVLNTISKVYTASKNSKLEKELFKKIDQKLALLAEYFKVSKQQAFLLANIFGLLCNSKRFEFGDFGHYVGCDQILVIGYNDDLDILVEKGMLQKKKQNDNWTGKIFFYYMIEESVNHAIIKNLAVPEKMPVVYKDAFEMLLKIYNMSKERRDDDISTDELFEDMNTVIESCSHFSFTRKVINIGLDNPDLYLFLYTCWKTLAGRESVGFNDSLDIIFDSNYARVVYAQELISEQNVLIANNWLELVEASFMTDTKIKLSLKGIELLKSENILVFSKKTGHNNIISCDKIQFRNLFFAGNELQQLEMIEKMLNNENFIAMQQRLTQKSMPAGIAMLLYGAPGTGKTESVYQFARKTGREIMHVDISESKSMWFGGSEKKIKQIFSDYNDFAGQSERCPILLFNEADAIFAKRKDSNSSNVAQTENAMQNIILEEMEKFSGILCATTNLTCNLDAAFERRFLFKIEFARPDAAVRSQIWKSKLDYMPEKDCEILADTFDLSGGQIDNIARKCEMFEVLNGFNPDLSAVMEYCNVEMINKKHYAAIGFKINNN